MRQNRVFSQCFIESLIVCNALITTGVSYFPFWSTTNTAIKKKQGKIQTLLVRSILSKYHGT